MLPTDVVVSYQYLILDDFIQISNLKHGTGKLIMNTSNTTNSCEITFTMSNNL